MNERNRKPLSDYRTPRLPGRLESRVIAAAGEALRNDAEPSAWDRIFESRPLRAAWGAIATILVAAHVALTLMPGSDRSLDDAIAGNSAAEQLREVIELPSIVISPNAERITMGVTPTPAGPTELPEPSNKEVDS